MQTTSNVFTGVMDRDSDPRIVSNENFLDAIDMMNGYGDQPGSMVFPKGNTEYSITLPAGTNICIGAAEDKQTKSLIFFVWNSNNNHRIFQYRQETEDHVTIASGSVLGFDSAHKITHAHIVDGEILYWTDGKTVDAQTITGQPPRKINLLKAATDKDNFEYELYAGVDNEGQFASGRTYTFRTTDIDGGDPQNENEYTATGTHEDDASAGLDWLKTNLEADYPSLIIDDCGGCKLKITYPQGATPRRLELETSDGDVILVGTNIYPATFEEQHIDMAKQPPHCAPTANYTFDTDTATNNVRRLCAQFRVRYVYDDLEKSAWGPVSNIALNVAADGQVLDSLNAINVVFTDSRLSDPDWLTMIRFVEISFRDGNTNDWKFIEKVPVCELGISTQSYLFRNDRTYANVPSDELSTESDVQVLKPFDYIPVKCGTLTPSSGSDGNNLMFMGACQELYTNPDCVDFRVSAVEATNDCFVDIIGTVTIANDSNFASDDPDFDAYPLGGIVVYLAGTSYYGVSNNPADGTGDGSFTIKNVPKGKKYIMRAASFRCSYDSLLGARYNLGNGLEWQKTSAPVIDMAGSGVATGIATERIIDLTAFVGTEFDLDTEVGYGDIEIANQHYSRRVTALPPGANSVNLYEVYVLDNEGNNASADDRISAWGVERQKVLGNARSTGVGSDTDLVTDHNGYCFDRRYHPSGTAINSGTFPIDDNDFHPGFTGVKMYNGDWLELENDDLGAAIGSSNSSFTKQVYFLVNEDADFAALRHFLQVTCVMDDGTTGLPGVLVVYERTGRPAVTGLDGIAQIGFYIPDDVYPDRDDDDVFVAYLPDVCHEGHPGTLNTTVSATDPISDPVTVSNFQFTTADMNITPARYLKGGGEYRFGVLYEDRINRTPGAIDAARLLVPVHTGGLTQYQMGWEIHSQPPVWATHWRIVRMLNAVHLAYVQWTVRDVLYRRLSSQVEDAIPTTFANGDATHIYLGLYVPPEQSGSTDTSFFYQQDGQAAYVPTVGDRVRFLLDAAGDPVNSSTRVLEAEISGTYQDADGQLYAIIPNVFGATEIEAGWLAEYFSPITAESGVWYEGGEDCYEIGDAGQSTRYHKGEVDQVLNTSPATGTYKGGDTYWRRKQFTRTGVYLTEHQSPSRYLDTRCEDIGRPFALGDDIEQQLYYNRIRVSAPYISDSSINGLSSFSAVDYQDINRKWGIIKWLGFANKVLVALCQYKVQPIYVGQGDVLYLDGTSSVGRSTRIMNIAQESVSDYGTNSPESVVSESGRIYFWDEYQGAVARYAGDGVTPITTGLVKRFAEIAATFDGETYYAYGGFDRVRRTYLITFVDARLLVQETYEYDEIRGGWPRRRAFLPEMYGRLGRSVISFKNGAMWIHDTNNTRTNYYGTQYKPSVKFACNPIFSTVKAFRNVRVLANNLMVAPLITTPATFDYASGQQGRLLDVHFRSIEGQWYATLRRDQNDTDEEFDPISPLSDKQAAARTRGRLLRGEYMEMTLEADDGSLNSRLTQVEVGFEPSDTSK